MLSTASCQLTSEQIAAQASEPVVVPVPEPEIDQRLIETVDYIDPVKLALLLQSEE